MSGERGREVREDIRQFNKISPVLPIKIETRSSQSVIENGTESSDPSYLFPILQLTQYLVLNHEQKGIEKFHSLHVKSVH